MGRFERRIAWIFGSPRSGSTWLLGMLARHPRVVPVDEPMIGAFLGPFVADQPGVDGTRLTADTFTMRRLAAGRRDHFFAEEFADVWLADLGRLVERRLRAQAERHPPAAGARRTLVVVKEPNGSQSADVISRALPESRFLFLLRDGRDAVDSELAASGADGWLKDMIPGFVGVPDGERLAFVRQLAHKWLWRTEVVEQAFAAHRGPKLLVRYEELLADPVARMGEVLAFLDAPLPDAELRAIVEQGSFANLPAEARGPGMFFRAASPGTWRASLSAEEQAAMLDVIGPKLAALGYGENASTEDG